MPAITIERIEAIALRIPMDHWAPPPLFAGRPRTTIDTLLVRVTTNRDVVGWGEAYGGGWQATVAALEHWVSPLALGQDATDAGLTSRLERTLHNLGRAGPVIHAISALDIALWDLRGKLEGVAVHALLGGRRRRRVEAYASLLSYGGSVEHVRRNVARALERGYRQIKLHERTAETVAATREVAGRDGCLPTAAESFAPADDVAVGRDAHQQRIDRGARAPRKQRWRRPMVHGDAKRNRLDPFDGDRRHVASTRAA